MRTLSNITQLHENLSALSHPELLERLNLVTHDLGKRSLLAGEGMEWIEDAARAASQELFDQKAALEQEVLRRLSNPIVLPIDRSAPFDPKIYYKMPGPSITYEYHQLPIIHVRDERSLALTELRLRDVIFFNPLREDEKEGGCGYIPVHDALERMLDCDDNLLPLDPGVLPAIWQNRYAIPESWQTVPNVQYGQVERRIFFGAASLQTESGDARLLGLCYDLSKERWMRDERRIQGGWFKDDFFAALKV